METIKVDNSADGVSPEAARDLAKATDLLRDSISEPEHKAPRESETISLDQTQIKTIRPEVSGRIETQDIAKFISEVYSAQGEREASQFLEVFKKSRETLEEPVITSFSAQSIYDSLRRYGLEVDADVFVQVVERTNARERVQVRKRNMAEQLGLPADATMEQIRVESKIRKQVDQLITRLPHLIEEGLARPEMLLSGGYLNLLNHKFRNSGSPFMTFWLGEAAGALDISEKNPKNEMEVEQLSLFGRLGRALGLYSEPIKEFNLTLKSPAVKDLLKKVDELGIIAELKLEFTSRFGDRTRCTDKLQGTNGMLENVSESLYIRMADVALIELWVSMRI